MTSITEIAKQFFEACETGQGWEGCQAYCTTDATFSAQAEPRAGVRTLQQYTDWMKGLLTLIPDGRYELKSFGTDDGVWSGYVRKPVIAPIVQKSKPSRPLYGHTVSLVKSTDFARGFAEPFSDTCLANHRL